MGVIPLPERRPLWPYLAIAYALLALATGWAVATGHGGGHLAVLVALAALWLPWLAPPRLRRRPFPAVYYAGLTGLSALLVAVSPAFTIFMSVCYPLALTLFSARWRVLAVAAVAFCSVAAQLGSPARAGGADLLSLYATICGVALPVIFAGWYVGVESDRRQRANERLREALAENAGLHAQLLAQAREAGVAEERRRMAREIHDTLAQGLIALITQLRAAGRAAGEAERERRLRQAERLAQESLAEARRAVQALRPEPLERSRLPEALAELARRWAEDSSVEPAVAVTGEPVPLLPAIEVVLYRVAQESLANVARHARAGRVGITLSYLEDVVLLDVRDDGAGFSGEPSGGFGLAAMRQRVRAVGGTLEIESEPGRGTTVAACVPAIPAEEGDG